MIKVMRFDGYKKNWQIDLSDKMWEGYKVCGTSGETWDPITVSRHTCVSLKLFLQH